MTAPIRSMLEIDVPSDAAWQRVHEAVKAFDPVRYDECETDGLLQSLFEIIGGEVSRGYKIGRRKRR